jgi:flagellin
VVGGAGAVTGFQSDVNLASITMHSVEQFVLDGGAEGDIGFTADAIVGVTTRQAVASVDVSSREGANLALIIVDRAIAQVTGDRAELGAIQNRLQSTINNLSSVSENAAAAKSRILDADFAAESALLARNQILTQAATTILAQANQVPQQALSLLQ